MSSFLDQATVTVKAGKGGDGMVAFRREKHVPDGGPAGGDGGKGGDVIFRVEEGLHTLMDFRYNRLFRADKGEDGMPKNKYGAGAEDLIVEVPPGTVIRRSDNHQLIADLTQQGQEVIVAHGGRGGRGNTRFATHRNPAPSIAENGEPGEELEINLELKMVADVGLIGYPSVGKSTLLSVISNATPRIADYQFTTLAPNLGVVELGIDKSFVAADMPGLIEGAAQGVGLGIDFLRHIERTKVLVHVIDMDAAHGRDPFQDFLDIQEELEAYNERLLDRPMILVANKLDGPHFEENLKVFKEKFTAYYLKRGQEEPPLFEISAWMNHGVQDMLWTVYETVQATDFVPLTDPEEEAVHYTLEEEAPPFMIEELEPGYFKISGHEIERLYAMTNMDHEESIQRFVRQMRHMGIEEALRAQGAVHGDVVELSNFQFEFQDE